MVRTVIVGLDGVPYRLLEDLANTGIMPNVKKIISDGIFKKMESSIPEISSVAWSSIITGKNPAEHGIFGFTDFPENTYRLSFPNFSSLKAKTFWENDETNKHIIINVPSTFPAKPLNGIMVSGFVALDMERSVYPREMIPEFEKRGYKIDVDSGKAHKSMDLFLSDLERTLEARIEACRYLWEKDWATFMLVFTGTDRLMHFLWEAYEDAGHRYHEKFKGHFKRIDEAIGEMVSNLKEGDVFMMLSDHGFEMLRSDVYINRVLFENGFLKLKNDAQVNFGSIDKGTRAFALDPSRIYVNLEGKYPEGSVSISDRGKVLDELSELFKNLEFENDKVIRKVYGKEEIFYGEYIDNAPDMVLIGEKGFNLKAAINAKQLFSKSIFTGKHTQDDAFLLIKGGDGRTDIPNDPKVSDIVTIINGLKRRNNEQNVS